MVSLLLRGVPHLSLIQKHLGRDSGRRKCKEPFLPKPAAARIRRDCPIRAGLILLPSHQGFWDAGTGLMSTLRQDYREKEQWGEAVGASVSPSLWVWEDSEFIPQPHHHEATPKAAPSLSPTPGMRPAHGSGGSGSLLSPTRGLQCWLNFWCFTSSPEPGPCSAASAEERSRFSGEPHA